MVLEGKGKKWFSRNAVPLIRGFPLPRHGSSELSLPGGSVLAPHQLCASPHISSAVWLPCQLCAGLQFTAWGGRRPFLQSASSLASWALQHTVVVTKSMELSPASPEIWSLPAYFLMSLSSRIDEHPCHTWDFSLQYFTVKHIRLKKSCFCLCGFSELRRPLLSCSWPVPKEI